MTENISAEIISIGTEILLGEITDTNSVHIARAMRDIGVNVYYMTSVGDNETRITNAIQQGLSRADLVITTGGLGPTIDDMTRQGVAQATGRELVFHQSLLDGIAARFAGLHSSMTANNRRQAYLPENALLIENPVGTAPCFIVEHEGHSVISLPGVPREMKYLLAERIVPHLKQRYHLGVIKALVLRAAGIGESALDDLIGTDLLEASNPTVGLAAHSGVVDMRITAKAEDTDAADHMIEAVAAKLRERVGTYIFGSEQDTIEVALVARLHTLGGSLAISDTSIDGAISQRIKAVPDGERVLRHHAAIAGISPMDQSQDNLEASAQQVARAIAEQSGATVGIAVISDPIRKSDRADSEIGTAIAVYSATQSAARVYGFGSQAAEARTWTVSWALSRAWRMLGDLQQQ